MLATRKSWRWGSGPDPLVCEKPPELQDKRSVIPVDPENYDEWLAGTGEEARALLRLAPVEAFEAGPGH
jgi:putative SOS response-associated peptidase YedK